MAANLKGFQNPTITKIIDQNVIDEHIYPLIFSSFSLEGGNNEIMH